MERVERLLTDILMEMKEINRNTQVIARRLNSIQGNQDDANLTNIKYEIERIRNRM